MSQHVIPVGVDQGRFLRLMIAFLRTPTSYTYGNGIENPPTHVNFIPDLTGPETTVLTALINTAQNPEDLIIARQGAAGQEAWPVTIPTPVPVTGAFFQATQPVSASALPLPTGAATEATLLARLRPVARTNVHLYAEAQAGIIAETLITHSRSVGYAAPTTGTSYTVTAGKTLRIHNLVLAWVATTTTANTVRVRIRVNPAGAAVLTSPIAFSARMVWELVTFIANEGETISIPIPEGIEVPAGGGVGITIQCVAANGTVDISAHGYEY